MSKEPAERTDLYRLADDGCPNTTGETKLHDLSELRTAPEPTEPKQTVHTRPRAPQVK
ncbi:hypothetical protein J8F10_10090 [Gemmata sp. G18]|uniref:Uncharacterized protein n=1 Tax=Gemmata palustris TaxID=2822762 RepID=A0ABS5BPH6_9BACT|nr:hypothetical protein [Gemmata palustris]MBP3955630.1 hypothetical protein [Gemmata palustris]